MSYERGHLGKDVEAVPSVGQAIDDLLHGDWTEGPHPMKVLEESCYGCHDPAPALDWDKTASLYRCEACGSPYAYQDIRGRSHEAQVLAAADDDREAAEKKARKRKHRLGPWAAYGGYGAIGYVAHCEDCGDSVTCHPSAGTTGSALTEDCDGDSDTGGVTASARHHGTNWTLDGTAIQGGFDIEGGFDVEADSIFNGIGGDESSNRSDSLEVLLDQESEDEDGLSVTPIGDWPGQWSEHMEDVQEKEYHPEYNFENTMSSFQASLGKLADVDLYDTEEIVRERMADDPQAEGYLAALQSELARRGLQ